MKKIYITSLHFKHGGIEKVICNLCNLFIKMNYDVEVLCVYNSGEQVYHLDNRVKITYIINSLPKKTQSLKFLLKKFDLRNIIIESKNRYNNTYLRDKLIIKAIKKIDNSTVISTRNEHTKLLNKKLKKTNKLIAQLHCDHTQYEGYNKDIEYDYSNVDYLLLLNDELRSEVEAIVSKHNKKTKCVTVPNFIEEGENVDYVERNKQIIAVGRLSIEKGFDRLLIIWKKFIINNKGYILKIVGDGAEREKLLQLVYYLKISDSVVFTGNLSNEETVKELRKSKLLVMTSQHEALPMVLLESISQGTPIVAYDVRVGPRAIIKDGYNGFLVKENDVETFAKKLEYLLKEDDVYNKMSKNAIISSKNYSKENLKEIWSSILK